MNAVRDDRGRRTGLEEAAEGTFHGWGVEFEDFESGIGNYSVAIVEMADGTVQTLMPWAIRFLDSDESRRNLKDMLHVVL
ncbi:hypothetical protein [Pseudomonas sp. R16(2017)]|uniref:hypothetical protein n=1 Tax=Pseudomonas sp. R16(2017) TaxID=1981704 RepID=UPI001592B056|nr:hypothetical protein [Pseudomonas sp. R16(2017)]